MWARDGRRGREVGDAVGVSEHGVAEGDACGHGGRCVCRRWVKCGGVWASAVWRGGRCEVARRIVPRHARAQMWRGSVEEGGAMREGMVRRGRCGGAVWDACGAVMRRGGTEARRHGGAEARRHGGTREGRAEGKCGGGSGGSRGKGVSAVWRRAMRGEKRCEVDETRACGAVRSMRA